MRLPLGDRTGHKYCKTNEIEKIYKLEHRTIDGGEGPPWEKLVIMQFNNWCWSNYCVVCQLNPRLPVPGIYCNLLVILPLLSIINTIIPTSSLIAQLTTCFIYSQPMSSELDETRNYETDCKKRKKRGFESIDHGACTSKCLFIFCKLSIIIYLMYSSQQLKFGQIQRHFQLLN